eukprot:jgi/Orpsp1_1/1189204/evm.model.d7180000070277.1
MLVFMVGLEIHLLNSTLLITGLVHLVQVIGLVIRIMVTSKLMELLTQFMKMIVLDQVLMEILNSNNTSVF